MDRKSCPGRSPTRRDKSAGKARVHHRPGLGGPGRRAGRSGHGRRSPELLARHARADHAEAAARVRATPGVALLVDLPARRSGSATSPTDSVELEAGDRFALRPDDATAGRRRAAPTSAIRISPRMSWPATASCSPTARSSCAFAAERLRGRDRGRPRRHIRSARGRQRPLRADLHGPALTDADRAGRPARGRPRRRLRRAVVRATRRRRRASCAPCSGPTGPPIVAKIETRPAVDDFDAICDVADAVMIARGDLGVELPYEEVPILQKQLVRRALDRGVPTIVATQMLESMIASPRPTRAEASDVANAIFDGADAIMLSAETAIGAHPVLAAEAATRIARLVRGAREPTTCPPERRRARRPMPTRSPIAAVALATADRDVAAIACYTRSGRTARHPLRRFGRACRSWPSRPDPVVVRRLGAGPRRRVARSCVPPTDAQTRLGLMAGLVGEAGSCRRAPRRARGVDRRSRDPGRTCSRSTGSAGAFVTIPVTNVLPPPNGSTAAASSAAASAGTDAQAPRARAP